jgi:hypothetical protein
VVLRFGLSGVRVVVVGVAIRVCGVLYVGASEVGASVYLG